MPRWPAAVLLLPHAVASSYNETTSIEMARLSGAAYCWTGDLERWSCGSKCSADVTDVKVCKGSSTKAFMGHWNGHCLLAFMGTENVKSMIKDLEFAKDGAPWDECDGCKVHGGFLGEWLSMRDCVKSSLVDIQCGALDGHPLHVTGHSLGAALAGISMMSLHHFGWAIGESYNFGMPRTGDSDFAKRFNSLFSDRFFRVTHHRDPVPQVPPSELVVDWHFQHVNPEIFYDGKVAAGHRRCDMTEDPRCADQYTNLVVDLLHIPDHLDYMGQDTSIFGCDIWPGAVVV